MLHRRTLRDDNKGVGEPLNELDLDGRGMRTTLKHYMVNSYEKARQLQFRLDLSPILLQGKHQNQGDGLYEIQNQMKLKKRIDTSGQYLKFTWVNNHDSFHKLKGNTFLRVQNMGIDDQEVDLSVLKNLEVMSLTTNMKYSEMENRRMKWNYTPRYGDEEQIKRDGDIFTIKPLQILTFKVK